jgi:hypothetical protein
MAKLLRPRDEFPTPLFRIFVGVVAAGVAAAPGFLVFRGVLLGVHVFLVAAVGSFAAGRRRLRTTVAVAVVLVLAGSAVELVVDFVTYPWG